MSVKCHIMLNFIFTNSSFEIQQNIEQMQHVLFAQRSVSFRTIMATCDSSLCNESSWLCFISDFSGDSYATRTGFHQHGRQFL